MIYGSVSLPISHGSGSLPISQLFLVPYLYPDYYLPINKEPPQQKPNLIFQISANRPKTIAACDLGHLLHFPPKQNNENAGSEWAPGALIFGFSVKVSEYLSNIKLLTPSLFCAFQNSKIKKKWLYGVIRGYTGVIRWVIR